LALPAALCVKAFEFIACFGMWDDLAMTPTSGRSFRFIF
jgi:hypothetical protein